MKMYKTQYSPPAPLGLPPLYENREGGTGACDSRGESQTITMKMKIDKTRTHPLHICDVLPPLYLCREGGVSAC